MKKFSYYLLIAILSTLIVSVFPACEDDTNDDPEPQEEEKDYTPVLDEDFSYAVDGNDVLFTTSLTGNVWFTNVNDGSEHTVSDGEATVNLPLADTYKFTCSVIVDGVTYTSDEFEVVIDAEDTSFLEEGVWKALTGGPNGDKTWVLDVTQVVSTSIDNAGNTTQDTSYVSKYFHNPLDFYGDEEAGAAAGEEWGPWGGTSLYDWGGSPEEGEISFDGLNREVTLTLNGETSTGSFSMETYEREPDFLILPDGTSLWDNMLNNHYSYLGSFSDEMADISFGEGFRFPMDNGRIAEEQFLAEDLKNVTILHASDSALVVRVKRTYEEGEESKCWLLYNYVVKGYDYGLPEIPTHPVASDVTASSLQGSWVFADVPGDWVGWSSADVLNGWADGAAMNTTFESWGITATAEKYAAAQKDTLTFNADGTCTILDVTYDEENAQEIVTEYETTYTVSGGYVTFADEVAITGYTGMLSLTGTNVYALDVASSTEGIWLGQNNGDKAESTAVHLIPATK